MIVQAGLLRILRNPVLRDALVGMAGLRRILRKPVLRNENSSEPDIALLRILRKAIRRMLVQENSSTENSQESDSLIAAVYRVLHWLACIRTYSRLLLSLYVQRIAVHEKVAVVA